MDELASIVETIGRLADKAEYGRWDVADGIAEAFVEFKPYERGLLAGLCQRLKRSSDSIYAYRNASELRERLNSSCDLSVSHFVTLHNLAEKYVLTDSDLLEWVGWAQDCNASVRELRQEVAEKHEIDAKAKWKRGIRRVSRLMDNLLMDAESVGVPDLLWQNTKVAQTVLSDLADKVREWD